MERKTIIQVTVFVTIMLAASVLYAQHKDTNDADWIKVVDDTCIYDNKSHAAFTTMEEWDGQMYVAFREGRAHFASDTDKGTIRVLKKTKRGWKTDKVFKEEGKDLRDPCFVKWNGKLLMYSIARCAELTKKGWSGFTRLNSNANHYVNVWKVRCYKDKLYCVGNYGGYWPVLMSSSDGINWTVIDEFRIGGDASEADLCFVGDSLYICLRIDKPIGSNSMWGKSVYPFNETRWSLMDVSVSSPEMIQYSDNTILLAGRERDYYQTGGKNATYVSLFAVDMDGKVKGRYVVDENSGDQGYPSFYRDKKDNFYMSYYTGQGQTSIRMMTFKVKKVF